MSDDFEPAEALPRTASKSKAPQIVLWLLVWTTIIVFGVIINQKPPTKAEMEAEYLARIANSPPSPTPEPTPYRITAQHYHLLRNGYSIAQCNTLVGVEGTEVSRTGDGQYELIMISWSNSNGSSMNATFQGGKMISKAQLGLR